MNQHDRHCPPPPRAAGESGREAAPPAAIGRDPAPRDEGSGGAPPAAGEAQPSLAERLARPHVIRIGGRAITMPASRIVRISLGTALVLLGLLGFLPVLGFWMVPLGLLILSIDIAIVRRWRRRSAVWFERNFPGLSTRLRRWTGQSPLRGGRERR